MANNDDNNAGKTVAAGTFLGAAIGAIEAAIRGKNPVEGAVRGGLGGAAGATVKVMYDEAQKNPKQSKSS